MASTVVNWFVSWHGGNLPSSMVTGSVGGGSTSISTGLASTLSALAAQISTKAAGAHTHPTADVTGLDSSLAGLASAISTKAAGVHTHVLADVTGLTSTLSGLASQISTKAAGVHTHVTADVTGLDSTLAAISAKQVWSSATLAFSYPPQAVALFTITDATVSAASHITILSKAVVETNDNAGDSDPILYACVPAAGSFQVYARGLDSPIGGNVFTVYQVVT